MTKQKTIFAGTARNKSDKLAVVRAAAQLPANLFGLRQDSQAISLDLKAFTKHLNNEGDSALIYIQVADAEIPVLIDEVQKNPITGGLLHLALKRVNLKEKIVSAVPIEMINEQEIKEGTVLLTRQEVEVEAYPADLPDAIVIDASSLTEIGQELRWEDITSFDRTKVRIVLEEEELAQPVVLVQEVKEEVEPEPEVVEGEVTAEGEAVEGAEATSDTPAADESAE